jgi:hypothetical protein
LRILEKGEEVRQPRLDRVDIPAGDLHGRS